MPAVKAIAEDAHVYRLLTNVIPTNIVQAMAEANMLQVIVFAIFFGVLFLLLRDPDRGGTDGTEVLDSGELCR